MSSQVKTITLTGESWKDYMESKDFFKPTGKELVKLTGGVTPKKGAIAVVEYTNKRGVTNKWYNVDDVTITAKPQNGAVKVKYTKAQQAKIDKLIAAGAL